MRIPYSRIWNGDHCVNFDSKSAKVTTIRIGIVEVNANAAECSRWRQLSQVVCARIQCVARSTKAARHCQPGEFDQSFVCKRGTSQARSINSDTILRVASTLLLESPPDTLKVGN